MPYHATRQQSFYLCYSTGPSPSIPNSSGAPGPANPAETRLEISELDQCVEPRSSLVYTTHVFISSETVFGILHSLPPLPTHEHQLCQFVSYLGNQGLACSSLKGYLSAIRNSYNYPDPNISRMPKLEQVLRGIKRASNRNVGKISIQDQVVYQENLHVYTST